MTQKKTKPESEVGVTVQERPVAITEVDDSDSSLQRNLGGVSRYDHLIELAITSEASDSMEKLEKLMAMQERFEANLSRKAYYRDMVLAQNSMPVVEKTMLNKHTNSRYADLGQVIAQTKPIYTKYGFSVSFREGDGAPEGHTRVYADVSHRDGHRETALYDIPMDGVGIKGNANMTAIHGKQSSKSYARRYLICDIFNIPTGDDDDGNAGGRGPVEYVSNEQLAEINGLAMEVKNNDGTTLIDKPVFFLKYLGVESFEAIPASRFKEVIREMEVQRDSK